MLPISSGRRNEPAYRIAMVVPLSGPAGIFGPSCQSLSDLAADNLNLAEGISSRRVELTYVDGGRHPADVAAEVQSLANSGAIDAVTGWHISSVRSHLAPVLAGRVPYVYTSIYEGGENRSGIYCSGETPEQQIYPAMRWLRDHAGAKRWYIVGENYIWPKGSFVKVRQFAATLGVDITGTSFVTFGQRDMSGVAHEVRKSGSDAVLMLLVGQDAVNFNQEFSRLGLHRRMLRFSPLMEENILLAGDPDDSAELYSSAAYFRSLTTADSLDLIGDYVRSHGPDAPVVNNAGQSCYQGIYTIANLRERARGGTVPHFDAVVDGLGFDSPRGPVTFAGNQAVQPVHLAKADGYDFVVIDTL